MRTTGRAPVVGDGGLRDRLGARGILPVGPPDADAREAIWTRYVDEITDEDVDIAALVAASELFTPADSEFAARKAAQRAFQREHLGGAGHRARTEDFLACIAETRPSLSEEIVAGFDADVREFARDSMPPAAVIFDCDGTLVDSEPLAWRAWRDVLAGYGYDLRPEDIELTRGRGWPRSTGISPAWCRACRTPPAPGRASPGGCSCCSRRS